ncbi:MAG: malate synthase G [Gammaproteobacteria bacterium]|nr:malate synthase G [Gammaproteobacteria bacterium]
MCIKPIQEGWLRIDYRLHEFVRSELCPGTGIGPANFWAGLACLVDRYGGENAELLRRRDELQAEIDTWLQQQSDSRPDTQSQRDFLESIGYLVPDGPDFEVSVRNVDPEIASIAGPQLVVPVDNARYALNAANARWGSLYDALYGTDAIAETPGTERGSIYNPERGAQVVHRAAEFLDEAIPLAKDSHGSVAAYRIDGAADDYRLMARLQDGREVGLLAPDAFVGYRGELARPEALLLRHHRLHIELQIDPAHPVGAAHPAGLKDVIVESAVSTIQDCEDSVAAVDAADKTRVYRNWLGLMRGDLEAEFEKNNRRMTRSLAGDRQYRTPDGGELTLPGRSLLLVRNVGMHMYTDAVMTADGEPIPEAFLDAMVTVLAAKHDILGSGPLRNSRCGSIYVVKPKLHGPAEVEFTVKFFRAVERVLGLAPRTVKLGIMDEERRTSLNLGECIRAAKHRVIFVNTGFLDRTGDELHTMMEAGAALPKMEIKGAAWMQAYEDRNVDVALAAAMSGQGQIGKGMWAAPDNMAAMLEMKTAHPRDGATTAWVPSPTAATLHAMHYHMIDVSERQQQLAKRPMARRDELLQMPLLGDRKLDAAEIQRDLDNNAQGILGYVSRWVELGIGCSKVPDINNVGLMEDRATLRISSQHIANWMRAGLVTREQVIDTFERMAALVDQQNAGVEGYRPMAADLAGSIGFQAALELVFTGREQANGYTEAVLHRRRREFKAREKQWAKAGEPQAAVAGANH